MPRHSTIAAYLALFIALGGTSYAAVEIRKGDVGSREIANGSVKAKDLARGSARPIPAARTTQAFTTAVDQLVLESDVLLSLKDAVKGERGEKGDAGQSVRGERGDVGNPGDAGKPGTPGVAIGYARVLADGTLDEARSANVTVRKASGTDAHYCVKASNGNAHGIMLTGSAEPGNISHAYATTPTHADCAGYSFEVLTQRVGDGTFADAEFFVTLN